MVRVNFEFPKTGRFKLDLPLEPGSRLGCCEEGFSLIEVVISVLLLVGVSAGLFAAFLAANRWTKPETNTGYNLAREKVESIYGGIGETKPPIASEPLGPTGITGYNRSMDAGDVINRNSDEDQEEDYKKAEVTVTLPS